MRLAITVWQRNELRAALWWLGRLLTIDAEYDAGARQKILREFAPIVAEVGEEEFAAAWQEVFGDQQPPLSEIRDPM